MSAKEAPVLRKTPPASGASQRRPEASEKTALSLEARRVSSVLGNCVRHVETAAALPAVLRLNSMSSVMNEELSQAVKEYQILDGRMKALEGLEQTSDGEPEAAVGTARARLEEDIKTSVGGLLRAARAHADVTGALRAELGVQAGESESMLIKGLQKFHSQVAERLLSRPDEELHAPHEQVHHSFSPDHLGKRAEEAVATAMMEMDAKVSQVNDQIQQLQRSLTGSSPEEEVSLSHSHIKSSTMRRSGVQQGIEQLNSRLHALMLKNREAEREIQEKNEKVETEIEYLLQTFDEKMEETQSNLELKREDYRREEEELRKQEKPFSSLEVKCKQIHEKRRLAEEKRREEMKEMEEMEEMELQTKADGEASERAGP